VETEIGDFNKVGYLSNLMEKYEDTNEWVAPVSNKTFASKEQTRRIPETTVLNAWVSCYVKEKTLACP